MKKCKDCKEKFLNSHLDDTGRCEECADKYSERLVQCKECGSKFKAIYMLPNSTCASCDKKKESTMSQDRKSHSFCHECGQKLKASQRFCHECGAKKVAGDHSTNATLQNGAHSVQHNTEVAEGFSWGFLFLPFLYSAFMKFSFWAIAGALVLQAIGRADSWVAIFLYYAIAIPLAFQVKKDAYNGNRKWESDEQFLRVQRAWDTWGIVLAVLVFLFYFLIGFSGEYTGY